MFSPSFAGPRRAGIGHKTDQSTVSIRSCRVSTFRAAPATKPWVSIPMVSILIQWNGLVANALEIMPLQSIPFHTLAMAGTKSKTSPGVCH